MAAKVLSENFLSFKGDSLPGVVAALQPPANGLYPFGIFTDCDRLLLHGLRHESVVCFK